MALRLEGLLFTNPKGLKPGVSSFLLPLLLLLLSPSSAALVIILVIALFFSLPLLLQKQ